MKTIDGLRTTQSMFWTGSTKSIYMHNIRVDLAIQNALIEVDGQKMDVRFQRILNSMYDVEVEGRKSRVIKEAHQFLADLQYMVVFYISGIMVSCEATATLEIPLEPNKPIHMSHFRFKYTHLNAVDEHVVNKVALVSKIKQLQYKHEYDIKECIMSHLKHTVISRF